MGKRIVVPFGSQHIAIPEPVSFLFDTENEIIKNVSVDVGYVHRGIEKAAVTKFEFTNVSYLLARICGFCSITHAGGYHHGIEKLLEVEAPKRAEYIRLIIAELDRIHSHLLANAHVAEVVGYENLFMQGVKDREIVMELLEDITGNRIQYDIYTIGGVRRDIDKETAEHIKKQMNILKTKMQKVFDFYYNDYTFGLKTKNISYISLERAKEYNVAGPIARASGLATDCRAEFDYLPYDEVGFEIQTRTEGDVWARNIVRQLEVLHSIDLITRAVDNLPEGDIKVKYKGRPKGEVFVRVEAPRGECFYYIKGNGTKILERVRVRVPTYANIPILKELFIGEKYSDAQAIVLSFDPCMSCTAR